MRLQAVILVLAGVQHAAASAVEKFARLSEGEILQQLREHPNVLPYNTQQMLKYKTEGLPINLQKRAPQSGMLVAVLGALQNTVSSIGKPWPQSKVPSTSEIPSPRYPEAKRKKVRYGPYRIPPISEKNVEYHLLQASGMTNTLKMGAEKPCTGNCMMLGLKASLEYEDGSKVPNSPAGAWLHHVVLLNTGGAVKDPTCGGSIENLFESGNERSEVRYYFPESGVKSGYHIRSSDTFVINTELMNMEDKEKWAWLALDFDYIDGFRDDWKESKLIWMSVGPDRCTGSEWNPFGVTNLTRTQQPIKDVFEEYSVPWKSPKNGLILGSNSHLHDGGIDTKVFLDNKNICTSIAHYKNDGNGGMGGHGHRKRQMGATTSGEHISEQGECVFRQPLSISKGQAMYLRSSYDFNKHPGMKNARGELDEVMAIAGALVAYDYKDWQSKRKL